MTVPTKVLELVERFDRNLDDYKQGNYNETQVRREFIDPFFKALGWDVDNEQGYAEAYKDVIHEDAIKVGRATKAPDYCFRIGGTRKFFLEAKKPSVNIKDDIQSAYQIRRYAWSAKLPLSILTDFEEFSVYDCRFKPDKIDKSAQGRTLYLTYKEYTNRWSELAAIFSREAVLKGSFDKYVESSKARHGTAEVDTAFLQEIERWRDLLAHNIALRNPELTQRELNFAVQQTIDRIIFLRICEDRGIERYGKLMALQNGNQVYQRLFYLFYQADDRYNSGLFHFVQEKGRPDGSLDTLTPRLTIDDKVLKDILKSLYYPDSPYEFSVLPADILGQVYEQFLGKVIRLTPAHRAVVEDKPEVKKAGGVYYTPTYIVDYIVEQTVGKLVADKKTGPRDAVSKLKILDPACGSGSFLLGAYQFLLDWHRDQYIKDDPQKWATGRNPRLYQAANGEWRLTTDERKRILLNNIYGVDIDPQAVEVTKLSLLLKVLEGEDEETLAKQLSFLKERVLPDLGNNIKCGNSLIGPDFYSRQQMTLSRAFSCALDSSQQNSKSALTSTRHTKCSSKHQLAEALTSTTHTKLDEEEMYRINVFDWETEFSEIMAAGGFDAVIGNPPYLRIQGLQEYYGDQIDYFIEKYQSAVKRFDLYLLFVEMGFKMLAQGGYLGFICPHKFLNSDFGSGLRKFLIDNLALHSFVSFGNNLVFNKASTYTGILLLQKDKNSLFTYYEFSNIPIVELPTRLAGLTAEDFTHYALANLTPKPWILTSSSIQKVLNKIQQQPFTLGEVFESIFQGVVTGIDEIYFLGRVSGIEEGEDIIEVFTQREKKNIKIERAILKPMLKGEDVSRYTEPDFKYYCIYPYKLVGRKTVILEENELSNSFPLAYQYLRQYRNELRDLRIKYKTNPKYWYSCHRSRNMAIFETDRIITPEISLGCNMTFAPAGVYHNTKVYSLIPSQSQQEHRSYWLGVLNSKVMWWFLSNTGYVLRGGYYTFTTNYLKPFPIRTIDFADPTDKSRHDQIVALVERILDLHKQLAEAKVPQTKTVLQRQIEVTDQQIDKLVYELYDLTEEEIKIVEEGVK
ncbi:restriction endonuclease subunit M [Candidatus Poribacteria bacterium]|nr:restriction endonuclease subunit M [Candidatus Poribacteria bacterium]